MAKYLLLKHYRGAPASANDVPIDQWTPEEVEAHVQFMRDWAARLEGTGEFVDGQALSPDGVWVRSRRRGANAGDRRSVRGDEGSHRRMDGHRRRQLRASDRARGRPVSSTRRRRRTDPRMAGGPCLPRGAAHHHRLIVDDVELRELVPNVLSVLVRRGADFATAEDAVQVAFIRALSAWQDDAPADPEGWLITVSWRAFIDMARSDAGASRSRGPIRQRAADAVWCRAPTTRCSSTSCARIPT